MGTNILMPTLDETYRYGRFRFGDAEANPALAGSANGGMSYRNLGARLAAIGGGGGWMNPYANGVSMMWDCLVHDGDTTWKDVIGGVELVPADSSKFQFTDDGAYANGTNVATTDVAMWNDICSNFTTTGITLEVAVNYQAWGENAFFGGDVIGSMNSIVTSGEIKFMAFNGNGRNSTADWKVACTVTAVVTSSSVEVYKNGVSVLTASNRGQYGAASTFGLGICHVSNWNSCYGRFYCIRVYQRILSADEITNNHAKDVERFWV